MPATTRSRSLLEPKGFKDSRVETAETRRAATRDCTVSTATVHSRSNTVATVVEDAQTPFESDSQSALKDKNRRRPGEDITQPSQPARYRSHIASLSAPDSSSCISSSTIGAGAGIFQPEQNAILQPSSDAAFPSSPAKKMTAGQDARRADNPTADCTGSTAVKTRVANHTKEDSGSSASSCSGQATGGGGKGGSSRRSLLPQPSSFLTTATTAIPAQAKRASSNGNLSGLKAQSAALEKKTSLASPTRLQTSSSLKKESANAPGSSLNRSLTLSTPSRSVTKKAPAARSLERASRTESDTKPSLRQLETPKLTTRNTTIKRQATTSSLKPKQSPIKPASKLPAVTPSSTSTKTTTSLRQQANPRLASSRGPTQPLNSKPPQHRPEATSGLRKPSVNIKTSAASAARKAESDAAALSASPSQPFQHLSALQTEVLQLQLFHGRALERSRQQEEEVRGRIYEQYQNVARKYDLVRERERAEQRYVNVTAIKALGKGTAGHSGDGDGDDAVSAQLESLSRAIGIISNLTDPSSGQYSRCVQDFRDWVAKVERIRKSRSRGQNSGLKVSIEQLRSPEKTSTEKQPSNAEPKFNPPFTEPLSQDWETDVVNLRTDLAQVAAELEVIGVTLETNLARTQKTEQDVRVSSARPSALLRVVNGHRNLVVSMIEELDEIRDIEADVMADEKDWLRQEADRLIAQRDSIIGGRSSSHIPVWRRNADSI